MVAVHALDAVDTMLTLNRTYDPWHGTHGTARPEQRTPPGDWRIWLLMAGRGMGKTRTGAEFIRDEIQAGRMRRVALVGQTAADARDVMVEGESGLLAVCDAAGVEAHYNPSTRRVTFPEYGAIAITYSAEKPRQLRGPQHDGFWADELASWKYPEAFDMLILGHRLGRKPRGVATGTPRPVEIMRRLLKDVDTGRVHLTTGTTYDNLSNLPESFLEDVTGLYEGTRLGRQELMGELLEDVEGALWTRAMIDEARVKPDAKGSITLPDMKHVTVAIDPATTYDDGSDETGIACVGRGVDGEYYVLHLSGHRAAPTEWARVALMLYDEYQANDIVYEGNQGGEMVAAVIRAACKDQGRRAPKLRREHVSSGKEIRAEPASLLYEQRRVHHVGTFGRAEDQMCAFPVVEDAGDDMVDALVHGIAGVDRKRGATRAKTY